MTFLEEGDPSTKLQGHRCLLVLLAVLLAPNARLRALSGEDGHALPDHVPESMTHDGLGLSERVTRPDVEDGTWYIQQSDYRRKRVEWRYRDGRSTSQYFTLSQKLLCTYLPSWRQRGLACICHNSLHNVDGGNDALWAQWRGEYGGSLLHITPRLLRIRIMNLMKEFWTINMEVVYYGACFIITTTFIPEVLSTFLVQADFS